MLPITEGNTRAIYGGFLDQWSIINLQNTCKLRNMMSGNYVVSKYLIYTQQTKDVNELKVGIPYSSPRAILKKAT